MALKLRKFKDPDQVFDLELCGDDIIVNVDGENAAVFYVDGKFVFYGNGREPKFEGRWDE